MSDQKVIPDAISDDFELALKAVEKDGKGAIELLTDVMLEGLEAMKPHGTNASIEDFAVRLNYVKAWAEWCHYVKPTPSAVDPNSSTEEIFDRIKQLVGAADSEGSPET